MRISDKVIIKRLLIALAILLVVSITHVYFLNTVFPLKSWLNSQLITDDDHTLNLAAGVYNSVYVFGLSAGFFPSKTPNNRIVSFVLNYFDKFDPGFVYKIFFVFALSIMPLIAILSFLLVSRDVEILFYSSLIYILYYWSPTVWCLNESGMFMYLLAVHLSLFSWAATYVFLRNNKFLYLIIALLSCAVAFFCHTLAPLAYLPFIVLIISFDNLINLGKKVLLYLLFALIPFFLNLSWISTAWSWRHFFMLNNYLLHQKILSAIIRLFVLDVRFWLLMLLLVVAIYINYKNELVSKRIVKVLFCSFIIYLMLMIFEIRIHGGTGILRYMCVLSFSLILVFSLCTTRVFFKNNKILRHSFIIFVLSLFIIIQQAYPLPDLKTGWSKKNSAIINFIKYETLYLDRILMEDSCVLEGHRYDGAHLIPMLPIIEQQKEYLGGPVPSCDYKCCANSFLNGLLNGRPIWEFTDKEIMSYLDIYDIKWIICYSDAAIKYFKDKKNVCTEARRIEDFYIYEVNRNTNRFYLGQGEAKLVKNKLYLNNIKSVNGEVIIKYHWAPVLSCYPSCKLEEASIVNDPVGFIKIIDPPLNLVIYCNDKRNKL